MTYEINTEFGPAVQTIRGVVFLADVLSCDAENGVAHWKARPRSMFDSDRIFKSWNSKYAGSRFGTEKSGGYRHGIICRRPLGEHRVIFAMATGRWPEQQVDHLNRKPWDNRIENLADVSQSINQRNRNKKANNTTGATGVYWVERDQRWVAKINTSSNKRISLGGFSSFEAALCARKAAEKKLGYSDGHGV